MFLTNSSISTIDGELAIYSNGCFIKNALNQIMPNGDYLNPGIIYDDNCPEGGYTARGGIIILPTPNTANKYYIFHQAFEVFNESPFVRINRLYYSIVDMGLNGGLGEVTQKNQIILDNTQYTGVQAVKHANNADWWIITMKRNGNNYYKTLLTENGVSEVDSQIIGEVLSSNGGGQFTFSPDGTKFAKFDFMDQLMLFDFDRETGLLSNYQQMEIDTPLLGFHGLAFSQSSRFLYLSTQTKLYQLDLQAPDILASKMLVGEYDGFTWENFNLLIQVNFQRMQLGPDCRIYMAPQGPVPYYHVINHPDEPGLACGFVQRGIELPCITNYSIPNFPNYRLGTGYPVCDSNIVYVSSGYVPPPVEEVRVYPNPATSEVTVSLPSGTGPGSFTLYNATGQQLRSWALSAGQQEARFGLEGLPQGMYFWQAEQKGKALGSGKLIIQKD
jgi:hypothetical protein